MTQPPTNGRVRRTERYGKPEDVTPAKPRKAPQPKPPIGRSAELQARMQRAQYDNAYQQTPLYSDFDPPQSAPSRTAKPSGTSSRRNGNPPTGRGKRRNGHTFLWFVVAMICLIISGSLIVFVAPQLLNLELGEMSNFAFVNGSVIIRDQNQIDQMNAVRAAVNTDRIHQGVWIDGVHVGGMTRQEAINAVSAVPSASGGAFDVSVTVEGFAPISINSRDVPLYRTTAEVVDHAYAVGRTNTMAIRGTTTTPLRQRYAAIQEVMAAPVGLWTQTTYDHQVVRDMINWYVGAVNREPVNASVASFDVNSRRFTFNNAEDGVFVDAEAIYRDVIDWLDGGVYTGTLHYRPEPVVAEVTVDDLRSSLGRVSTFTTKKTGNTNRTTNIDLSAKAINGVCVMPGETFSFNKATGERTEEKGYKPAAAINSGETVDEIGGGVCQTSTTLFNAVVRADLKIVTRKPHAWPSDYVDRGEDAMVNWPDQHFKFQNNTDWPVYIVAWCDKSAKTLTVEIYGRTLEGGKTIDLESTITYQKEPPPETLYVYNARLPYGTEKQTKKARTGYEIVTYKVYYQNGTEIGREKLHTSSYPMYQKTIEHNKPDMYGM